MAPSRGKAKGGMKVVEIKRKKERVQPTGSHRFETFTQRISKLNINPVRQTRQVNENESSYFRSSFEEWKDLNMSEHFTNFAADVEPLCQSLAQILHHENEIVNLLVKHLEKDDRLSLEPLLSLTAHFAHDLGTRFEPFFKQIVTVVCQIASKNPNVEVIEWSFNCLAWLFKYLQRLLVPNLRPLYDLIAPLLGKEHHKPFVTRFAAEAMSFLVRKAGASYQKDPEPLDALVEYVFEDVIVPIDNEITQHQQGLMVLFAEAIKGVNGGLNSSGPVIFKALLSKLLRAASNSTSSLCNIQAVLECVLVNVMHHTDASGFEPLYRTLIYEATLSGRRDAALRLEIVARLVFILAATRKGTRIRDWPPLLERIQDCVHVGNSRGQNLKTGTVVTVLNAIAVSLQLAPLTVLGPFSQAILSSIGEDIWAGYLLGFFYFAEKLHPERFHSLVRPYLQRFIENNWNKNEEQLCLLLPQFSAMQQQKLDSLIPDAWEQKIQSQISDLSATFDATENEILKNQLLLCNRYLDILDALPKNEARSKAVANFGELAKTALSKGTEDVNNTTSSFALCKVLFKAMDQGAFTDNSTYLFPTLLQVSPFHRNPFFLDSIILLLRRSEPNFDVQDDLLVDFMLSLNRNLASPSHALRVRSLLILEALYLSSKIDVPQVLSTAMNIENGSFTFENARTLSMSIRQLSMQYEVASSDPWLKTTMPSFCFGLLHIRFAPLWDDTCNALRTMSSAKDAEDTILQTALEWIEKGPGPEWIPPEANLLTIPERQEASDYQCTNALSMEALSKLIADHIEQASEKLEKIFDSDNCFYQLESSLTRKQGLRVLCTIPQSAEKRSRLLVPFFLQSVGPEENEEVLLSEIAELQNEIIPDPFKKNSKPTWSRQDHKTLLELFAKFSNPKVLYRSKDVYDRILALLCNGDIEIQKLALKVVFAWNAPSVRPYKENVLNILDDAKFRDEVALFINVDENESMIQREHREDLMPILLRLLYGKMISGSDSSKGHSSQEAKRRAVLMALARLRSQELDEFINIALGPLDKCEIIANGHVNEELFQNVTIVPRNQLGALKMIEDILKVLANLVQPFAARLIHSVLYCTISVSRCLSDSHKGQDALSKAIRRQSVSCVNILFATFQDFDWTPFMSVIMEFIVNPRLDHLSTENTQSVSGLLKLFSTWTNSPSSISFIIGTDSRVAERIADCLADSHSQTEVKLFIINSIMRNIMNFASNEEDNDKVSHNADVYVDQRLRDGIASIFLSRIAIILSHEQNQDVIEACVWTVVRLTPFTTGATEIKILLDSAVQLLKQPTRRVNPRLKGQLLQILEHFVSRVAARGSEWSLNSIIEVTSSLFGFFQDMPSRQRLVQIMIQCSKFVVELDTVAEICEQLNALSPSRVQEPDFERRQHAFRTINEQSLPTWNLMQWRPILYNMLFFIKDNTEIVIRTNASLSIRRFVEAASLDVHGSEGLKELAHGVLIPELRRGMRENSELVRAEYVSILSDVVKRNWSVAAGMQGLLGPDDESSFFNNILHIQTHRRIRALKRLCVEAIHISSDNIAAFFIPLVEKFVSESDSDAQNLAIEAISAVGGLAEHLEWQKYRLLLQKRIIDMSEFNSKVKIRALGAVTDALSRAINTSLAAQEDGTNVSSLAKSLPKQEKLSSNLSRAVLPILLDCIHFKDESTVHLRLLVAPIAIKVVMMLSPEEASLKVSPLLMDICNILRSKSQEVRDAARKTLADICAIIGPMYFSFVLKQLRGSLQRGSHLHILSYTVHSILVSVLPNFNAGELDYCVADIMSILMNDIFGATSQEKEARDYVSKMREVRKKTLSYDSMEIIASFTSLRQISSLIAPLQQELAKPKVRLDKIDELLRRLREGLRRNPSIKDQKFLIVCYELLNDVYVPNGGLRCLKTQNSYKMVSFAFESLRRILDKHENLKSPENLAGFMPFLDLTLKEGEEEMQISALRFLTSIIKVPLIDIDEKAGAFVHQAKHIFESSVSTVTPLAQTSLRLISAILRERPEAVVKQKQFETDIAFLLSRIRPDLQEPARSGERERQVAAFNFLKALLGRGVLMKEVYEVMDTVREVMITNSEHPIPDLSRAVFSRFLLDYFPEEGKGLGKQVDFLVANLQYERVNGRKSTMEVIHFLLSKKDETTVQPLLITFFLPMLLVLVTDDSEDCQQSASLLLRKVFERANRDTTKKLISQLRDWLSPDTDVLWRRVAMQSFTIYFDVHKTRSDEAIVVFRHVDDIIRNKRTSTETNNEDLSYDALALFHKFCEIFPEMTFAADTMASWNALISELTVNSPRITISSVKLLGLLLRNLAGGNQLQEVDGDQKSIWPLIGANGLQIKKQQMLRLVDLSMQALYQNPENELISRLVANLAFIGKICAASEGQDIQKMLFARAASVVRKNSGESDIRVRLASLQLIAALCKIAAPETIRSVLEEILLPLYTLTDKTISQPSFADSAAVKVQDELVNNAQELLNSLQTTLGTGDFLGHMQEVQREVRDRRDERRAKRRIDVVSAPEKAGREKARRHQVKKVKRKEKNAKAAGMRRGW